jgi:hypothetical protein
VQGRVIALSRCRGPDYCVGLERFRGGEQSLGQAPSPRYGISQWVAVEFNRGTRLTLRATPRHLPALNELTEIVRSISRRIAEVGLGDKQAILDQYADILRLRNRLASTAPEDKAWTRDALDVSNRFTFRLRRMGRSQ